MKYHGRYLCSISFHYVKVKVPLHQLISTINVHDHELGLSLFVSTLVLVQIIVIESKPSGGNWFN